MSFKFPSFSHVKHTILFLSITKPNLTYLLGYPHGLTALSWAFLYLSTVIRLSPKISTRFFPHPFFPAALGYAQNYPHYPQVFHPQNARSFWNKNKKFF